MITVEFKGILIPAVYIYDLIPEKKRVIIRPHLDLLPHVDDPDRKHLQTITVNEREFESFKFGFLRYLKTMKKPEDRVADFEYRKADGLPDFDKLDRLIERRKTRAERDQEFQDELWIKNECEKYDIEYLGPLRRDRQ